MIFTYLKQEYVFDVANLICSKYKGAREKLPLLSSKYENMEIHLNKLNKYIDNDNFLVVIDNSKIIGFMNGIFINNFKGTAKGALVLPDMHGVADGYDKNKLYNLMYTKISEIWAKSGCFTHAILLNVNEKETLDTWFLNGFGFIVIDAVRPLTKINLPEVKDDLILRQAKLDDLHKMVPLFQGIENHLYSAPIFLYNNEDDEDYVKTYTEWLKIENNHLWVAEKNNEIIGYLKTNTSEINLDELDDGETMAINGAYVLPEYRSNHIMARLINLATEWAISKGLKRCSTDFETANLEGRSFWLKHFTPYSYALIRKIDERNYL